MSGPNTAFIAQWRQNPVTACRAGADPGWPNRSPQPSRGAPTSAMRELRALQMLIASPHGRVELAKGLGVTSAASCGMVE